MAISSEAFRDALRHFPSGVTLVALRAGTEIHGLTVSAFASVSPEPPLICVMVDHRHRAFELLCRPEAVFSVNILGEDQKDLSEIFAWRPEQERFRHGTWTEAVTGAPVLVDALAWLDCRIFSRMTAGTHELVVGEVVASGVPRANSRPLVYWNRGYRRLESD